MAIILIADGVSILTYCVLHGVDVFFVISTGQFKLIVSMFGFSANMMSYRAVLYCFYVTAG